MHEVTSGAEGDGGSLAGSPLIRNLSDEDAKAAKLWKVQGEAESAAKLDAAKRAPPRLLEKGSSLEEVRLFKAYTKEYIKQLQGPEKSETTTIKVSHAASRLTKTPDGLEQAEIALDRLREMEREQLAGIYGNKAANLIELEDICQELRLQGISVEVPQFMPLSHDQIQAHLDQHYEGSYKEEWQEFAKALAGKAGKSELAQNARSLLEKIQKKIEKAFREHPLVLTDEQQAFLKSQTDARLMVRSTGKEDSAKSANAGGNLSEAGVMPDAQSVSSAIGKVIASYHSPLSLTQRLLAGDEIAENPFTPVFLQKMIGENPGDTLRPGEIPVSGVVYTRELLGETEHLTQIQAAFGHNEAVVMSSLPVDTFYVYPGGNHHDIVQPKDFRLVADPQVGFITKENPPDLSRQATLGQKEIQTMQVISEAIHAHYGRPQDIEWVYDPTRDTFYIVQARPLVKRYTQDPMSVDEEALRSQSAKVSSVTGSTVVNRGNRATLITSVNEVIVDTSIERAFNRYWRLAQTQEGREQIKAVIVRELPAGTSHYAATLREMGVPVFCSADFDAKGHKPNSYFLIDHLDGKIFSVEPKDKPADSVEALITSGAVKRGWSQHPISARETVRAAEYHEQPEKRSIVTELCQSLLEGYTPAKGPNTSQELRDLLRSAGQADREKAGRAVQQLTFWLYRQVETFKSDPELYDRGVVLLQNFVVIANHLIAEDTTTLQQLHLAKRLTALLCQERTASIINADALLQLLHENAKLRAVEFAPVPLTEAEQTTLAAVQKHEIALLQKKGISREVLEKRVQPLTQAETRNALAVYAEAGRLLLTPEAKQAWNECAQKIARSGSRIANRQLLDAIHLAQEVGILGEWLNIAFIEKWKALPENSVDVMRALVLDMANIQGTLQVVADAESSLRRWGQIEDQWADPAKFETLHAEFKKTVLEDIAKINTLFSTQTNAPPLARQALARYLQEAVDLYDRSIKSMRSSPQYENKKGLQAQRFHQMLQGYFTIMERAISVIDDDTITEWSRGFVNVSNLSQFHSDPKLFKRAVIEGIAHILSEIAKVPLTEAQLRPSSDFNVLSVVMNSGSSMSLELRTVKTLEDAFSLMHQNILAALTAQYQTPWEGHLPGGVVKLQEAVQCLKTVHKFYYGNVEVNPNLLDVSLQQPNIILKYSIPLKLHAAVIYITYNTEKQTASIDFRLLGHNMGGRMDYIANNLFIESVASGNPVKTAPLYDKEREELSIAWTYSRENLQSGNLLPQLTALISKAMLSAFEGTFGVVKAPPIGELNLENLSRLWTSLETLQTWKSLGTPHFMNIIDYFLKSGQEKKCIELLNGIGIRVEPSDEPFQTRVDRAIIQAYGPSGPLRELDAKNQVSKWAQHFLASHFPFRLVLENLPSLFYESAQDTPSIDFLIETQIEALTSLFKIEGGAGEKKMVQNFDSQKWNMVRDFSQTEGKWPSFVESIKQNLRRPEFWKDHGLQSFSELLKTHPQTMEKIVENSLGIDEMQSFINSNRLLIEEFLDCQLGNRWRDEEEMDYINLSSLSLGDVTKISNRVNEAFMRYFNEPLRREYIDFSGKAMAQSVLEKGELHKAIQLLGENRQYETLSQLLKQGKFSVWLSGSNVVHVPVPAQTRAIIESYLANQKKVL